jgi:hypothetical protein
MVFKVRHDSPLIGVPVEEHGEQFTLYFESAQEADAYFSERGRVPLASVIGAWSDIDEDEMLDELDRIRHSHEPTPIIERLFDDD